MSTLTKGCLIIAHQQTCLEGICTFSGFFLSGERQRGSRARSSGDTFLCLPLCPGEEEALQSTEEEEWVERRKWGVASPAQAKPRVGQDSSKLRCPPWALSPENTEKALTAQNLGF
jgi:hypothetical protein